MALIVIPRRVPWRRRPESEVRAIDSGDGLVGAFLPTYKDFVTNLVTGERATLAAGSIKGPAVNAKGRGLEGQASDTGRYTFTDPALQPTKGVTVFVICQPLASHSAYGRLFMAEEPSGAPYEGYALQINSSDKVELYVGGTSGFTGAITWSTSPTVGQIYGFCGTYNKSDFKLYVDAAEVATQAKTEDIAYTANALPTLFNYYPGGTQNFRGIINIVLVFNRGFDAKEVADLTNNPYRYFVRRTQLIFIPIGGALSLSSAATLRDGDKPIATQQKAVSVDALIRAADLLIGSQQKSLTIDALLADADKLSMASRHEATLASRLLDGDIAIAPAKKAGSISGLLQDADKATGASSKAALVTGLLLDGDLLTALGSQIETHLSAGVLSGADVLIAGVTTNRTTAGKAQDGDALTVASAIDRLSAALGIDADTLTGAATSARSIGAVIVEGDAAIAGIQSGRLQPALLIDGDILIIASSTVAQADLAGRINLTGRYAPQVSLVGVYAPAVNLKGRVH